MSNEILSNTDTWNNSLLENIDKKNIISETLSEAEDILSARKIDLQSWFTLNETWPKSSNTLIINLPTLFSDWPWSLADWFIQNWKHIWFTSFWLKRSSYTNTLEQISWSDANKSLIWYLDYPKKWDFNIEKVLDDLVSNILEKNSISTNLNINIHWASMWWKIALQLAIKLAEKWIKVNKLFVNGWALIPEHIKVPIIEQEIKYLSKIEKESVKSALSYLEARLITLFVYFQHKIFDTKNELNEFNDKDRKFWDKVNEGNWINIIQIAERLNYLKKLIEFEQNSELLKANVWEVIAINSIPKKWAKNDWMVSTKFPEYLREIFWNDKVKEIQVKWLWHYMVPNNPWKYTDALKNNL